MFDLIVTNLAALEGDLSSIVVGLKLRSSLKCSKSKIPDNAITKIEDALTNGDEPISQLHALLAAGLMSSKGLDKAKVDEAVTELLEHLSNDGFKVSEDVEMGSGYYTGLLLEALSLVKPVLSKDVASGVTGGAVDSVKSYLSSSAVQDDSVLSYPHFDSSINDYASTAILLDGIVKFNRAYSTRLTFNDDKVNKLSRFFLSRAHVTTVEGVHAVLVGLHSLNAAGTPWRKPLIITASQTSLRASAKGDDAVVRFRITDLFGNAVSKVPKLFLVSLTSSESTGALINNQELSYTDAAGVFEFNLLAIKPAPGSYKLVLSATPIKPTEGPQTHAAIKSTTRFVKVISSIEVSELTVTVRKSKEAEESGASATPKKHSYTYDAAKASPAKLEVTDSDVLEFGFHVKTKGSNKAVTVQQAFVLLAPKDAPEDVFFYAAKYDASKKAYSVTASMSRQFARGASFTVKVLIGDSYVDNSISWEVANVVIKASAEKTKETAEAAKNAKPTVDAALVGVNSYKPQILHKFRPAERRANSYISRLFTLIVIAPLAIFVLGLLFVGLNFGNCPSGLGFLFAVAFHALIIANAYIIYLFFAQNNLFETLRLLCYSVPPTFFIGQRALRAVAAKRAANLQAAVPTQ